MIGGVQVITDQFSAWMVSGGARWFVCRGEIVLRAFKSLETVRTVFRGLWLPIELKENVWGNHELQTRTPIFFKDYLQSTFGWVTVGKKAQLGLALYEIPPIQGSRSLI